MSAGHKHRGILMMQGHVSAEVDMFALGLPVGELRKVRHVP